MTEPRASVCLRIRIPNAGAIFRAVVSGPVGEITKRVEVRTLTIRSVESTPTVSDVIELRSDSDSHASTMSAPHTARGRIECGISPVLRFPPLEHVGLYRVVYIATRLQFKIAVFFRLCVTFDRLVVSESKGFQQDHALTESVGSSWGHSGGHTRTGGLGVPGTEGVC